MVTLNRGNRFWLKLNENARMVFGMCEAYLFDPFIDCDACEVHMKFLFFMAARFF